MSELLNIRAQFPAIDGDLVYLDSAATTQKPQAVIDCITQYYGNQNANVHRGSHSLTAVATERFEAARETVARFINAASSKEIIWTRGQPKHSILSHRLTLEAPYNQGTRFWFLRWNIMQILSRGKSLLSKLARRLLRFQ